MAQAETSVASELPHPGEGPWLQVGTAALTTARLLRRPLHEQHAGGGVD